MKKKYDMPTAEIVEILSDVITMSSIEDKGDNSFDFGDFN